MSYDFIVTVHALERFQKRFPNIWKSDEEAGQFIYGEAIDALDAGRVSSVPPLELANNNLSQWAPGKAKFVWTPDKMRGYVLIEAGDEMMVATVLVGRPREEARRVVLSSGTRVPRGKEKSGSPDIDKDPGAPRVGETSTEDLEQHESSATSD